MENIETIHHKKTVAADMVGFKLEADLVKSVPVLLGFSFHGER